MHLSGVGPHLATFGAPLWCKPSSSHPWEVKRFSFLSPCLFYPCPPPALIFYPPALCSTLIRNQSQIPSSPVKMFQWLPMDGVLTPALELEVRSARWWFPDIILLSLPCSYCALVYEPSLFPWTCQDLLYPRSSQMLFALEEGMHPPQQLAVTHLSNLS